MATHDAVELFPTLSITPVTFRTPDRVHFTPSLDVPPEQSVRETPTSQPPSPVSLMTVADIRHSMRELNMQYENLQQKLMQEQAAATIVLHAATPAQPSAVITGST